MPEGPEVRTIVRELQEQVVGNKVVDFVFADNAQNLIVKLSQQDFKNTFINQRIISVNRFGKYIDLKFENNLHILLHLLITGRLSLIKTGDAYPRYFRCAFVLDNNKSLCLGDRRQWTKLNIYTDDELNENKSIVDLGVDVFSGDFTYDNFVKIIDNKQAIHALLLDQKKISGLGNIYANEVLFLSNVHPSTKAKDIPIKNREVLFDEIKKIMDLAYQERGTTIEAFLERDASAVGWHTLDGSPGGFWKHVKIFQQEGKPCTICGTSIERSSVGSRSVFFCTNCQPRI